MIIQRRDPVIYETTKKSFVRYLDVERGHYYTFWEERNHIRTLI